MTFAQFLALWPLWLFLILFVIPIGVWTLPRDICRELIEAASDLRAWLASRR